MSVSTAWSPSKYRRLLDSTMPVAIQSEDEYERMLASAKQLMGKGENLREEEGRLLKLLAVLIEDYEQRNYPLPKVPRNEMVRFLLEERKLKARDLWPVIGSKSRVSEILSGKRTISKNHAKKLAGFFQVGVELFI